MLAMASRFERIPERQIASLGGAQLPLMAEIALRQHKNLRAAEMFKKYLAEQKSPVVPGLRLHAGMAAAIKCQPPEPSH